MTFQRKLTFFNHFFSLALVAAVEVTRVLAE